MTPQTGGMAAAFNLDSLLSSHPVESDVKHPGQIDEVFDAISYNKGCAVIRMLVDFLGLPAFRTGISAYLKK